MSGPRPSTWPDLRVAAPPAEPTVAAAAPWHPAALVDALGPRGRYAELETCGEGDDAPEASPLLGGHAPPKNWRCWAGVAAVVAPLVIALVIFSSHEQAAHPTWEVTKLTIDNLDLPGLQGLIPADNSACPSNDPCGVSDAKGCSVCPTPGLWNDGCLCRKDLKGHTAPAGEVVQADNSRCPQDDPCGMNAHSLNRGCATCPDDTWINEGCSCRQPPMSAPEFFEGVGDFFSSILGLQPTVIKMRLRADAVVTNPADIGARAQDGIFNISYRGTTIGSAAMVAVDVPPRGTAVVSSEVQVDHVPATTGALMLNELLSNERQLPVLVTGSVMAIVGPLKVHCSVRCDLVSDVSALPEAKFSRKDCQYLYQSVSI